MEHTKKTHFLDLPMYPLINEIDIETLLNICLKNTNLKKIFKCDDSNYWRQRLYNKGVFLKNFDLFNYPNIVRYIFTLFSEGKFDIEPGLSELIYTTGMFKDIHRLIGKHNSLKRAIKLNRVDMIKYYSSFFNDEDHSTLIDSYYNADNTDNLWDIVFKYAENEGFNKLFDYIDITKLKNNKFIDQINEILTNMYKNDDFDMISNFFNILKHMMQIDEILINSTHIYNDIILEEILNTNNVVAMDKYINNFGSDLNFINELSRYYTLDDDTGNGYSHEMLTLIHKNYPNIKFNEEYVFRGSITYSDYDTFVQLYPKYSKVIIDTIRLVGMYYTLEIPEFMILLHNLYQI